MGIAGAAGLGVKVKTSGESVTFEHLIHAKGRVIDVKGELVGIPAQEHVPLIGVDAAQHAVHGGDAKIVLEGMSGKRRVIGFDVQLEILVQPVLPQKSDGRCGIKVVLVLHGLLRFGFDIEVAGKTDTPAVVHR